MPRPADANLVPDPSDPPDVNLLPAASDLPLRSVAESALAMDRATWPATLAPVRAALDGLVLAPLTVLVGENGSGKSTLVEGIATAWGFPAEGGGIDHQRGSAEGPSLLGRHLALTRGSSGRGSRGGFFLRAETLHSFAVHLVNAQSARGSHLLRRSHGESFLDLLLASADDPGLWILDEPESALSFQSQLTLVGLLHERAAAGHQVLMATHSPILASLPGALLLEAGEWGLRQAVWEDLDVVAHWRSFLDAPARYHRHLMGG